MRHGETELNVKGVYYGWTDCDINDQGCKQAGKLKSRFESIKYDKVIVSSLKRAVMTAQLIIGNRDVPLIKSDELREINFGDWENKSFEYVEENDTENCHNWWIDWKNARIPNGETFMEFYGRVSKKIQSIIDNNGEEDVLIVAHNGTISCILCYLIGIGAEGFWKFKISQEGYSHISIQKENVVIEKINSEI